MNIKSDSDKIECVKYSYENAEAPPGGLHVQSQGEGSSCSKPGTLPRTERDYAQSRDKEGLTQLWRTTAPKRWGQRTHLALVAWYGNQWYRNRIQTCKQEEERKKKQNCSKLLGYHTRNKWAYLSQYSAAVILSQFFLTRRNRQMRIFCGFAGFRIFKHLAQLTRRRAAHFSPLLKLCSNRILWAEVYCVEYLAIIFCWTPIPLWLT